MAGIAPVDLIELFEKTGQGFLGNPFARILDGKAHGIVGLFETKVDGAAEPA